MTAVKRDVIRRLLTCAFMFALLASVPPAANADGGTVVVGAQTDAALRQAIMSAAPNDTVVVPVGTYKLTAGELLVDKSLTISGAGAGATTIERSPDPPTPPFRIFHTTGAGNIITISGVTISGGLITSGAMAAGGGGVMNDQATLTLSKDIVSGNTADGRVPGTGKTDARAIGGGVYNTGTLNLVNTDINGNLVTTAGHTGQAGGQSLGGGVASEGAGGTSVRGSTFEHNTADASGPLAGFSATGGGLLASQSGPISIADSTFHDNTADASSGSVRHGTANGGGAVLGSSASVSETNVTFTANIARATAATAAFGGGMFVTSTAVQTLTNVTLAGNSAVGAATNKGGNIWVAASDMFSATAAIENTVIASGVADTGFGNCGALGTISSLGHNVESRNECNFHASGDLIDKDPLLGTLADNGGPVETMALKSGSPAIDAGAADACPPTDARGIARPAGHGCDVGAFEVATPIATTGQAGAVSTSSAVLSGTGSNPDFAAGTASFEYGTTTAYGSVTPAQPVGPARAKVPVSATVSGLSPATTYHFRIVVRNAVGSAAGADQTLTTATVFHPAQLTVRAVSVAGATTTLNIACDGSPGQRCAGTVRGTVEVRLRGRSIVSIAPDSAAKRRSGTTERLVVATGDFSAPTGRVATLRITANAVGKRLLARFYRLPTQFVFAGFPQVSRTITFAYPPITLRPVNYWLYKNPPCGLCVTLVQTLVVPHLPSGARVAVSCNGSGCPFARRAFRPSRSTLPLTGFFAHSRLGPGTRIEILITARNRVGEAQFYTTRAGTYPLAPTRCLPPGMRVPVACLPGTF